MSAATKGKVGIDAILLDVEQLDSLLKQYRGVVVTHSITLCEELLERCEHQSA